MAIFDDWTRAELVGFRKQLSRAYASGTLRVRYADRDVQYNSPKEMLGVATEIDQAINVLDGCAPFKRLQVSSIKGFQA